jgi:hypothetical protein
MTIYYDAGTILKSVGALTEQDAILPTGTDLTVRIQYLNDALGEWSDKNSWEDLINTFRFTTNDASTASIGLPTNFRNPMSSLWVYGQYSQTPTEYPMIYAPDRFQYSSGDNYAYTDGVFLSKSIQIPNILASGVSVTLDFISFPSSIATTTDYVPISSSQYLVKRIASMVFQARGDSRFPQLYAEAQRFLENTIEEQYVPHGRPGQVPINNQGFQIGVDG